DGDAPRERELPGGSPMRTPNEQVCTRGVELLDPVEAVSHVHVTLAVDGDAAGTEELARTCTISSPLGDKVALSVELLNSIVVGVRHVTVPLCAHGDVPWPGELAVPCAPGPPLPEETAVAIELLDAIVLDVRHEDITLPAHRNAEGTVELPVR